MQRNVMKKGARKKVRLWGPASGGGVTNWPRSVVVPCRVADALLLRLSRLHTEGAIGSYHIERQGFLGAGGAVFWVGRVRKVNRAVCGAKTRAGVPCKARCVSDRGRCRLHGGLSSGPKTAEGRERIRESNRRRAELRRSALIADEPA